MTRIPLIGGVAVLCAALLAPPAHAVLVIHYDASDASSVRNTSASPAGNGDAVGEWLDLAGPAQNAAPTVGNPVYDLDGGPFGQPAIDFNVPVSNLVTGSTQAQTITLVHRWDTASSGSPAYLLDARNGIGNSFVWEGSIGPNWTAYVNDSTTATAAVGDLRNDNWQITTLVGTSTGTDDIHLFSRHSDNEFGLGRLAEVRVFDTALTESQRLAVVDELNTKWFTAPPPPVGVPVNVSLDKPYAYFQTVPGQPSGGNNFYFDDPHDVHTAGLGVFDTGDLTDGAFGNGTGDGAIPSPTVAIRGSGNAPPVDIIFDLEDMFAIDNIVVGTSVNIGPSNLPPDDVSVSFSTDGMSFSTPIPFTLWTSDPGTGHAEMTLPIGGTMARFVQLSFDGGNFGNNEKYILDEITVNGFIPIPEPATASLALLGVAALMRRRRAG